jgi:hypothetical protein
METKEESEDDPSDDVGALGENIFTNKEHVEEEPNPPTVKKPIKVVKQQPEPITKVIEPDETPLSKALTWSTNKNVEIDLVSNSCTYFFCTLFIPSVSL